MQKSFTSVTSKVWFCLLILSLFVTMAACGGTSTPPSASGGSTPTVAPTTPPAPTDTAVPTTAPTAAPTTAPTSNGNSVTIASFAFGPDSLTVKAGTKVTWTNNDSATHTVTADKGAFNSGNLPTGSSFSFTFNTPGTYTYHCAIHRSMTATIIVQ